MSPTTYVSDGKAGRLGTALFPLKGKGTAERLHCAYPEKVEDKTDAEANISAEET